MLKTAPSGEHFSRKKLIITFNYAAFKSRGNSTISLSIN
jgi:hypothetical protein